MTKIAGSGSISQRHGSADPDPHQNVMDLEHCITHKLVMYNVNMDRAGDKLTEVVRKSVNLSIYRTPNV
jgi:hypothetical protein